MIRLQQHAAAATLVLMVAVVVWATLDHVLLLWGLNHFSFLGSAGLYALAVIVVLVLAGGLGVVPKGPVESLGERLDHLLFRSHWSVRAVLAALLVGAFILFRARTHFLGDGPGLIAIIAKSGEVPYKWTEMLSTLVVRLLSKLFGPHTDATALLSFRIVSWLSGAVWIVASWDIARRLGANASARLLLLGTLLGSGSLLMFAGYVEFYPQSWMAIIVFFVAALAYLDGSLSMAWPLLVLVVACCLHAQALVFVPAALVLVWLAIDRDCVLMRLSSWHWVGIGLASLVAIGFASTLLTPDMPAWSFILPLFDGRARAPGYYVFSPRHLIDIVNLLLLIAPALPVLLALVLSHGGAHRLSRRFVFFAAATIGSLAFLVFVYPEFGMVRDWDLMSYTVLPLTLLLLTAVIDRNIPLDMRLVLATGVLSLGVGVSYWAVYAGTSAGTLRTITYLRNDFVYRDYQGWHNYSEAVRRSGDQLGYENIMAEMKELFPDHFEFQRGFDVLRAGNLAEASEIANRLMVKDPYDPNHHHLLANVLMMRGEIHQAERWFEQARKVKPFRPPLLLDYANLYTLTGQFDKALPLLERAHRIDPDFVLATEQLALTHIRIRDYPRALAVADTLETMWGDTAMASLVRLFAAVGRGERTTAKRHYREFLRTGANRPDLAQFVDRYAFVLDSAAGQ